MEESKTTPSLRSMLVEGTLPRLAHHTWQRVRHNKLVANATVYVSGYALQKAASFLLIPLWARFLTPEDYGITGTLTAYSGVLSTLLLMGLHGAVVRHYYDYTDSLDKQKRYVSSVMLFQVVAPGLITVALNVWGPALWVRYTADAIPFDPYVRLMLWATYADLLVHVPLSLYQAQQKARQFVYIQYGKFLLNVAASLVLVVALRMGAYGVLLSQLLSVIIVAGVVSWLLVRTWLTWRVAWKYLREALAFGLPLVPHALGAWILQAADRVILERFVSLNELGLYNFGYMLGMAMQVVVTGINQAWAPYYYRLMQTDSDAEKTIVRVVSIYVALIGGLCLVATLFAGEIIHLVMPMTYHGAAPYVGPVLLGYVLLGLYYFSGMPLFYYKKTNLMPFLTGAAAVLNIALNLWLVPLCGAIASAWATTVTYGILFLLVFFAGRQYQRIHYPIYRYGLLILLILLSAIGIHWLEILDARALAVKAISMTAYLAAAYLLLIAPRSTKRPQAAGEQRA